ncbi:MAG: hypothetical protein V3T70_08080, partial [Phycisphaerae bacterium]
MNSACALGSPARIGERDLCLRAVLTATVALWLATPTLSAPIPTGDIAVVLETVVDGLASPIGVTHAGDGSGRLFIVEQVGQI